MIYDTALVARRDRPRIWMVCGRPARPGARLVLPGFVADALTLASDARQLGHPFQLLMAEAIVAQEYARVVRARTRGEMDE